MATIARSATNYFPIVCTSSASTSAGISLSLASGACVLVDAVDGGASSVTFYIKEAANNPSSYLLVDAAGNPISQNIAAGEAFPLPTETFAASLVVPVTNAGTATLRYTCKG